MQRKRLRLWIILSTVCASIFCLFLLINFSFKLKTVDVEFQSRLTQTETKLNSGVQDEVKTYFAYNKNIIFMQFDDAKSKVEKDIPFLKVNQIIKNFPNIVRVYISERIPKYRLLDNVDNMWLILDEDFKVLEKLSYEQLFEENQYQSYSYFDKTIEISNENISENSEVGNFINGYESLKTDFNLILGGIYGKTEDYSCAVKIEQIKNENDICYNVIMRNNAIEDNKGCNILIEGQFELKNKAFAGASTFLEEIKDCGINIPSTTIKIYYSESNQKFIGIYK